ncbi:SET domain [Plasmodium coatneyi]|uniref:SET domain n=1 Tax=Plasmodium coatneyi TaxID=208452 RepID=A0A1B1DWB2_9APIC|nr:SET domain [Plasmodium coatneyi]ANQ06887.1 SET domain [Plasmodium coatneyi]
MKEKNGRRNNPGGGGKMGGSQNGSGGDTTGDPIIGGNNLTGSAFTGGSDNAIDNGLDNRYDAGGNPVEDSMDAKPVEVVGQVNVSKSEGLNNLNWEEEVYYVDGSDHAVENLDEEKKGLEQGEEPELCNEVLDSDKCAKESNHHNWEAPLGESYMASEIPDDNLGQSIIQSFQGDVCNSSSGRGDHPVEGDPFGVVASGVGNSVNCMDVPPEEDPQFPLQNAEVVKFKKRGNLKFIKRETNLKSGMDEEKEEVIVSVGDNPSVVNPVDNIGMSKVGRKKGRQGKSASSGRMDDGGTFQYSPVGYNVKEYNHGNGIDNGTGQFVKNLANKAGERKKGTMRKGKMKTKKKGPQKKKSKGTLKGTSTYGRLKYETTHAGNVKIKNEKKRYLKGNQYYNYNDYNSGAYGSGVIHDMSNKFSNIKISKHFFLKMDDDEEEWEEEEGHKEDGRSSRNSSMSLTLMKKNFQKKIIILDERANGWTGSTGNVCSTSGVGSTDCSGNPSGEGEGVGENAGENPPDNSNENKVMKKILTTEENATLLNNVKEVNTKRFNFSHIISSKDSLMEQFMLYNLFSYDIALLKGPLKFIYTYCLFKNLRLYYQIQDKNVYIDEKAISNCRIKDNLIDTHSIILAMYENYCKSLNKSKIPIDDFFNLNYFNIHNVKFAKKNVQHNKNYDDSILPEKDNRKISSMYKFRPYLYSNCSNDEKESPVKVVPVDAERKGLVKVEEGGEVAGGGSTGEIPPEQISAMDKDCPQLSKDASPVMCKVEDAPCDLQDLPQESQPTEKEADSEQVEPKVVMNEAVKREEEEEDLPDEEVNEVEANELGEDSLPTQKQRKRKMLVGESKDEPSDCTSKKQRGEEADMGEGDKDSQDVQCENAALLADGETHQVGSESIQEMLPLCQVKKETPDVVECEEKPKCEDAPIVMARVKSEEKEEKADEGKSYNCMMIIPPEGGTEEGRAIVKSEPWEEEPVTPDGRRKHLTEKYNELVTKGGINETGEYRKKQMLRNRYVKEEKGMREVRLGRGYKKRGSSNVSMKRGRKNFFCNNNLSLMKNRGRRRGGGISSMRGKRKIGERTIRGGESHFRKKGSDYGEYTEYGEDVSELGNVNVMLLERIKNNYKRIMENNELNRKKREEKMMLMSGRGGGTIERVDNLAGKESAFPEGGTNANGVEGKGAGGPSGTSGTGGPDGYTGIVDNNIGGYNQAGVNNDDKINGDKLATLPEGDATTGANKSNNNELWEKKYMLSVDWLYHNNFNILDIKVNTHFSHNYHIALFFLCKYTSYNLFLHPINKNEHIVSSVILNSKNEVLTDNGNFFVLRYLLSFLSNKISSLRKCYANALYNSYLLQMPIRIFRHNNLKTKYCPNYGIRYDGIYKIVNAFTINDYSTSEYKRDILYVFKRLYVDKCFIPRNCRFYENQCERKKYLIEKNSVSINVFLDSEMIMTLTVPYLKNYKSTTFMNFNHIYKFIRRRCIKEKLASKWVRSDVRMYEMCKRKLREEDKSGQTKCNVDAPTCTGSTVAPTGTGGAETFPFWCRGKYLPLVLVLETLNFEKEINENQRIRTKNLKNIEISIRKTEIPINCEMAKRPAHLFIPIKSKEAIAAHIELKKPFDDTWNPYEDLSAGKEKFKIPVENTVDDSLPPMNFTYVSKTLFFSRLPPYNLLPLCSGCAPQNYSKKEFDEIYINGYCKALRHKRTGKIYCDGNKSYDINDFNVLAACSGNCLCDPLKCTNKFPEGLHYPVKVVKTRDIGWDIVSSSYIKANSLIMHYVGEITTRKEMISREHEYDKKGYFNYFIETAEVDETYTDDWKIPCIDALFISNVARFLNHSCEPNVNVITIWRGDNYPSVGIFASRDIKPDEPLKYHYGINYKNIKCMCNSKKCKGYIG